MQKSRFIVLSTIVAGLGLAFTSTAFSQSARDLKVESVCTPVHQLSTPFYAGLSQIEKVRQVTFKMDQSGMQMTLTAELFKKGYAAVPNQIVDVTETYALADAKTGTMLEWRAAQTNEIPFAYVITNHTEVHVETAGPIPPGTHKSSIDLVLISNYPTGRITTGLIKVELTCDETYTY